MTDNLPAEKQHGVLTAPDFMTGEVTGIEEIAKIVRPPYLRIVQSQAAELLEAGFEIGDTILRPADIVLPPLFTVTPVLFYNEYWAVNPREAVQLPMIRERSLDPDSDVAIKAAQMVREKCPEMPTEEIVYQHMLMYLCYIHDIDEVAIISFYRAEFKSGAVWGAKIKARRQPIFAGRYQFEVVNRSNAKGNWKGFQITNCPNDPWVTKDQYDQFAAEHDKYKEMIDRLIVNPMDDSVDSGDSTDDSDDSDQDAPAF